MLRRLLLISLIAMILPAAAMEKKTSFYVHPPQNKHWKMGFPTTIVEVEKPSENKDNQFAILKVIAPKSFKKKWDSICKNNFIECKGPAGELTWKQYIALIHKLKPDFKHKPPKEAPET